MGKGVNVKVAVRVGLGGFVGLIVAVEAFVGTIVANSGGPLSPLLCVGFVSMPPMSCVGEPDLSGPVAGIRSAWAPNRSRTVVMAL